MNKQLIIERERKRTAKILEDMVKSKSRYLRFLLKLLIKKPKAHPSWIEVMTAKINDMYLDWKDTCRWLKKRGLMTADPHMPDYSAILWRIVELRKHGATQKTLLHELSVAMKPWPRSYW